MFGLGLGELLIILLIVLIVFSRRLPDVGESLAKGLRKFRRTLKEADEIDITPNDEPPKQDQRK